MVFRPQQQARFTAVTTVNHDGNDASDPGRVSQGWPGLGTWMTKAQRDGEPIVHVTGP